MSLSSGSDPRVGTEGFSLVEVMCAMAIAAIALVTLLRSMGGTQQAASYLESHLGARIVAQSIIGDEMQAIEPGTGKREGNSGPYHWTLTVEPANIPAVGRLPPAYRMYALSVNVTWEPRGSFSLEALKLGR